MGEPFRDEFAPGLIWRCRVPDQERLICGIGQPGVGRPYEAAIKDLLHLALGRSARIAADQKARCGSLKPGPGQRLAVTWCVHIVDQGADGMCARVRVAPGSTAREQGEQAR